MSLRKLDYVLLVDNYLDGKYLLFNGNVAAEEKYYSDLEVLYSKAWNSRYLEIFSNFMRLH